jgi:uncharacterized protein
MVDTKTHINNMDHDGFESTELFATVHDYVRDYMSRYDASHDFNHILRVLALAKHIRAQEIRANPSKPLSYEIVVLAALLHDVGDKKYAKEGENAGNLIWNILSKSGYPTKLVAKVALIAENVSYSNEVKRPQLIQAMIGAHPELAVVQDADRLDAIGAVGIGRVFAFGAVKAPDRGLQGCIDHFDDKLLKIESMMKTATGKRMARERTERLRQFREWWVEETGIVTQQSA